MTDPFNQILGALITFIVLAATSAVFVKLVIVFYSYLGRLA